MVAASVEWSVSGRKLYSTNIVKPLELPVLGASTASGQYFIATCKRLSVFYKEVLYKILDW